MEQQQKVSVSPLLGLAGDLLVGEEAIITL